MPDRPTLLRGAAAMLAVPGARRARAHRRGGTRGRPAVAQLLQEELVARLGERGTRVRTEKVHPLPASDGRGLVAFDLAVGWVVGGYLGPRPSAWPSAPARGGAACSCASAASRGSGLVVGLGGALIAGGIAGYDHGLRWLVLFGS